MLKKKHIIIIIFAICVAVTICYVDSKIREKRIEHYYQIYLKDIDNFLSGKISPVNRKKFLESCEQLKLLCFFKYNKVELKYIDLQSKEGKEFLKLLHKKLKKDNGCFLVDKKTEEKPAVIQIWAKVDLYSKLRQQIALYEYDFQDMLKKRKNLQAGSTAKDNKKLTN